jgi:hypothetical protein
MSLYILISVPGYAIRFKNDLNKSPWNIPLFGNIFSNWEKQVLNIILK